MRLRIRQACRGVLLYDEGLERVRVPRSRRLSHTCIILGRERKWHDDCCIAAASVALSGVCRLTLQNFIGPTPELDMPELHGHVRPHA